MEKLKCFIDGNCLCIVKNDFINLQESEVIFLDLSNANLKIINNFAKR